MHHSVETKLFYYSQSFLNRICVFSIKFCHLQTNFVHKQLERYQHPSDPFYRNSNTETENLLFSWQSLKIFSDILAHHSCEAHNDCLRYSYEVNVQLAVKNLSQEHNDVIVVLQCFTAILEWSNDNTTRLFTISHFWSTSRLFEFMPGLFYTVIGHIVCVRYIPHGNCFR